MQKRDLASMSMSGVKDVKLTERPWRKSRLVGWLSAPLISCFFEVFFFFDTYDASPFFGTPSFATDNRVFSTHMTARTHTYMFRVSLSRCRIRRIGKAWNRKRDADGICNRVMKRLDRWWIMWLWKRDLILDLKRQTMSYFHLRCSA